MTELTLTRGKGTANADGCYVRIPSQSSVQALAASLSSTTTGKEAWWSPIVWGNNHRSEEQWVSACGVTIDIDYEIEDAFPSAEEAATLSALASNPNIMPGSLWHATPHGGRIVAVFREQCLDKQLFRKAFKGLAQLVAQAILDTPFKVDKRASDLARMFYVPNTFAKNARRSAKVVTLREDPYSPEDLAKHAPQEVDIPVINSTLNKEKTDVDYAADAWNDSHAQNYPPHGKREKCPVCKDDNKSFSAFKHDSKKWRCYSTHHDRYPNVGHTVPSDLGYIGDALDLEAFTRGCKRMDVLRKDGYWPLPNKYVKILNGHAAETPTPPPMSPEPPPSPAKTEIVLSTQAHEVIAHAITALTADQDLYQRGCRLVRITTAKRSPAYEHAYGKTPEIDPLIASNLLAIFTKNIQAVSCKVNKKTKETVREQVLPPNWLLNGILSLGSWEGIRPLEGLVESPIMRADGTVLDDPGYDPKTGLLYKPAIPFQKVKENPSFQDAAAAAKELLDIVCDFPFSEAKVAKNLYQSAWLSSVLTPFVRVSIPTAPLFLMDSNVRGSGKSLLCDIAAIIATGRPMPRTGNPPNDEEFKKLITSIALAGSPLMMIDNITGALGSSALDAVLTAATWRDRILGKSEVTKEIPLAITWFATGNNTVLRGDLCRRTIHVRLRSDEENPETREGFKHKQLLEFVLQNRAKYVNCALTILRAFKCSGAPQQEMRAIDFRDWSTHVRNPLIWLGYPDPGITQVDLSERDGDRSSLALFLDAFELCIESSTGVTASGLIKIAMAGRAESEQLRDAIGELCPFRVGTHPNSVALGKRLAGLRNRVVEGRYLDHTESYTNQRHWIIKKKIC